MRQDSIEGARNFTRKHSELEAAIVSASWLPALFAPGPLTAKASRQGFLPRLLPAKICIGRRPLRETGSVKTHPTRWEKCCPWLRPVEKRHSS
jgi:hypothetical protein